MKIALTVWEGRISPVFDSARTLLIATIEKGAAVGERYELFRSGLPYNRAVQLFDLDVKVLICGAISHIYTTVIETYDIEIIPFVSGDADQVLDHYLKGTLFTDHFMMPGCGRRGRRSRNRCGREYVKHHHKKERRYD